MRVALRSIAVGSLAAAAACNAITGAEERTLDPDLGSLPARDSGDGTDEDTGTNTVLEAGPTPDNFVPDGSEAGPLVIEIDTTQSWTTLNGGVPTTSAGGVKITGMDASANNHPIVIPMPQPNIPGEDYTIRATILAPPPLGSIPEFGIIARLQPGGGGVVLGNVYGANPPSFLGQMNASWNPANNAQGPAYTYVASARYKLWMRMTGSSIAAKFWISTDMEPQNPQILYASPFATGKGVGFYTYFTHDTVLEEMTVTVP